MREGSKTTSEVFRKRFRTIPEHSYMFPDIDYFQLAPYRARDIDLFRVGESKLFDMRDGSKTSSEVFRKRFQPPSSDEYFRPEVHFLFSLRK